MDLRPHRPEVLLTSISDSLDRSLRRHDGRRPHPLTRHVGGSFCWLVTSTHAVYANDRSRPRM